MKQAGNQFFERFLVAWQAYERVQRRKVSAQELAEALGVSAGLVSQWQRAEEPPPHERIRRIAEICNVDPGWLAYWPNTGALPPGQGGWSDLDQAADELRGPAPRATPDFGRPVPHSAAEASKPAPRGTPMNKQPVRPPNSDEGAA